MGTSNRHGARSVTQFEVLPKPPERRPEHQPWPYFPIVLNVTTSHEEGAERRWSVLTKDFQGAGGRVEALRTVEVVFETDASGRPVMTELPGTERVWPADLVLLAIGYAGPEREGLVEHLGLELDARGNVWSGEDYMTSRPGVFAAGDARRGQSLVVWAISEGREAARHCDEYLMQRVALPAKGGFDLPRVR